MRKFFTFLAVCVLAAATAASAKEPFVVKAAELNYSRIPKEYWERQLEMCRALGLNTICLNAPWNIHEPQKDKYDFTGNNDIAGFCRLAQKHGIYVIVRPVSYACTECELDCLPWWLLKKNDIRMDEQDPYFMERVRKFKAEVENQLGSLTIDKGGPIIMMDVEFQCEWDSNLEQNDLEEMLIQGESFSISMNPENVPTPKYHSMRETMQKYASKKLPPVPRTNPIISIPEFEMTDYSPLTNGIASIVENRDVVPMEPLDQGSGCVLYSTTLPEIPAGALLTINEGHDFSQVFVNGEYEGKIDRAEKEKSISLPAIPAGAKLELLVESMGRINFGALKDYKGITENVLLYTEADGHELTYNLKNWLISLIPDDYDVAVMALNENVSSGNLVAELIGSTAPVSLGSQPGAMPRGYYRGTFRVRRPGDTFIDMSNWGKGQVWVNGNLLGYFCSNDPQQALYCPAPWLKRGNNEIIVCDVVGPQQPVIEGVAQPTLDNDNIKYCKIYMY